MTSLRIMIGLAATTLIALSGQALAHAHLKSATPAEGVTVTASPAELDLVFLEGLNLKFTGIKVTGPDRTAVSTGAAGLRKGGDTVLVVPVAVSLGAGTYTVDWHALSADGHKTSGSYQFSVKP